jgi:hypothetical protein
MGNIYRSTTFVRSTPRRQFTLAGMLSFVLAVGVYCAMLASLRPLFSQDYWEFGRGTFWPNYTTVPTAWCVLWWLYRRWRLPQAQKVHYTGPVIALVLLAVWLFFAIPIGIVSAIRSPPESYLAIVTDALSVIFVAMLYACGVSTVVSFPAATMMLVYLMVQPPSDPLRPAPRLASSQQLGQTPVACKRESHE